MKRLFILLAVSFLASTATIAQEEGKTMVVMSNGNVMYMATVAGTDRVSIVAADITSDEGVVIDGIRWATRNVNAPGTFTANPQDRGMSYQWNRNVGWTPPVNPFVLWINSNGEIIRDDTTPTGTEWYAENCPCPPGWRVPTREELESLSNSVNTWVTNWNNTGIDGRVYGTYPNQIFLVTSLYWSSTQSDNWQVWSLLPYWNVVDYFLRYRGSESSVRCVSE